MHRLAVVISCTALAACAVSNGLDPLPQTTLLLQPGDVVTLVVAGHPDMGSTAPVGEDGTYPVAYLGRVDLAGSTIPQAEQIIGEQLVAKHLLVAPSVSVQVVEAEVFVVGEVNDPGSHVYSKRPGGLTVSAAVALAGGVSYRGNLDDIAIERQGKKYKAKLTDHVLPGDVVTVGERLF
jgi:protein involved in polysaccharide export with SLBB domain